MQYVNKNKLAKTFENMNKHTLILVYWIIFFILLGSCFFSWTYYPDTKVFFNGFYSYQNVYGKPAWLLLVCTTIVGGLLWISQLWARYISLGIGSVFFAYSIRTFYLYSSCYNGICPEIFFPMWLMMFCVGALFFLSLFGKVKPAL